MPSPLDPDRFLQVRSGNYRYYRRVPAAVSKLDPRSPTIRISLKTDDLALARAKRDALEAADDELWGAYLSGNDTEAARALYSAAVKRAAALGFTYRHITTLLQTPLGELRDRLTVAAATPAGGPVRTALLGLADEPSVTVFEAWEIYRDDILAPELIGKSKAQREDWEKVKLRAVNNFIALNGNLPISSIQRDPHALKVYDMWRERIAPDTGRPTHSASSGNRDLGNMRQLFERYHAHVGKKLENPFAGLGFSNKGKRGRRRPAFSTGFLRKHFVNRQTQLLHLNRQARAIIFIILETGGRPSEICNLDEGTIHLDTKVPYITIEPRDDPDDPREIKTESSIRVVPLVGVALAAAKAFPNGFPRYRNKERTLSNTLTKSLRKHGLLETPKHKAYSLRHAFEDRMKAGMIDPEIRKFLMGHTLDRPEYGSTANLLKHVQGQLQKIALPFDASIV